MYFSFGPEFILKVRRDNNPSVISKNGSKVSNLYTACFLLNKDLC